MKIKESKLAVSALLLCVFQFFALFRIGEYIYKTDLINVSVILLSFFLIIFKGGAPLLHGYTGRYYNWTRVTILLWVIEVVFSTVRYYRYGQDFITTMSASFGMLAVVLVFPLSYYQEKSMDIDLVKKLIKKMSLITACLAILQVFVYDYGIVIIDITGTSMRYDSLRVTIAGYAISIAILITIFDWIEGRNKKDLVYILIYTIYLFYVQKTRSEIIYVLGALYFVVVLFLKRRNLKVFLVMFGVVALIAITVNGFLGNFISNILSDAGVVIRFDTIAYYWTQFCENPIMGMGFIKPSTTNSHLAELLSGPLYYGTTRYYYRDDVGIIGLLNEKGIIGLIWYIGIMLIMFKQIYKMYHRNQRKYTWMLAVWIYILMCSLNLIYVNNLRLAMLMVFASMLQHYEREFYRV